MLALNAQYRWFYHLLMLSLIAWLYFVTEESKTAVNIVLTFYVATMILPGWWEALSDELAEKLSRKLELSKNKRSS
jgi:hypothetical protein